jgi:precorrin-2 dehydrogenase/sirohydrochlorin ferrochelatase
MASLFPIFLKLEGRRVLVVGAGHIAEQKLHGLLDAGAKVVVVAETASATFTQLAKQHTIELRLRSFNTEDVKKAALVIAATGNPAVNQQIYDAASAQNILCNAVDEPSRCDFYYPAVVRRGDLQIAISTNGKSPALAQRIRAELEARFGEEYSEWLAWLGSVREVQFRHAIEPERRREMLHQIASQEGYDGFQLFHSETQKEVLHG